MWIIHVQMHQDSSGVTEIFLKKQNKSLGQTHLWRLVSRQTVC